MEDMARIAFRVAPDTPEGDLDSPSFGKKMCDLVNRWLKIEVNRKWLMIVDNVDLDSGGVQSTSRYYNLNELLPGTTYSSILITTRDAGLHVRQQYDGLELQPFDSKQGGAIELLAAISGGEPQSESAVYPRRLAGTDTACPASNCFPAVFPF